MKVDATEVELNGIKCVRADSADSNAKAKQVDGMDYVIVRTYSAGVFAGYLKKQDGKHVTLLNARRLWFWKGAATLSQLATDGVSCPNECKFPCEVASIDLTEAIEVISTTIQAQQSIAKVKLWTA